MKRKKNILREPSPDHILIAHPLSSYLERWRQISVSTDERISSGTAYGKRQKSGAVRTEKSAGWGYLGLPTPSLGQSEAERSEVKEYPRSWITSLYPGFPAVAKMVEAVPLSNIIVCALFLLNTASQKWNDAAALILSFIKAKVYWVMYYMLGTKLLLLPINIWSQNIRTNI